MHMKVNKLTLTAPDFPEPLKYIPQPPKQLYVLGNIMELAQRPVLAVVGSRKVTAYGKHVTTELVGEVARQGVAIVSGLALGVDGLAHQAALEAGGYTVAVMPCSLDQVYPSTHRNLAKRILEQSGALISEYPPGTAPRHNLFIERNRLVSGLAQAILITEAAEKSGTLHTAGFALEQGKTVLAVPGNITSPLSQGTNTLIKSGAIPVTSSQDIFEALGLKLNTTKQEITAANAEEAILIQLLQDGITDAAELLIKSELSAPVFNQTLTMMEINGKIAALGAGNWSLK
jgi:DNA processing protein